MSERAELTQARLSGLDQVSLGDLIYFLAKLVVAITILGIAFGPPLYLLAAFVRRHF